MTGSLRPAFTFFALFALRFLGALVAARKGMIP
jgi:hypothetical protein